MLCLSELEHLEHFQSVFRESPFTRPRVRYFSGMRS